MFLVFFAVYTVLQLSLFKYWNKKNPQYLARLNSAKELSVGKLFEGLNNIQTIKSLGAALGFQSSIDSSQHELRESTKAYEKLGVYKWISISFLDTVFMVIFFLLVGYNVIAGAISVGFVFVLYTYFGKLQSITGDLTNKFGRLVEVRLNVERMLPLFESITHNVGTKNFPQDWATLKLEEVRFVYNLTEDKTVFQNINLTINRGEFVGVTGESGSGKSSLLKLLLGLYPISSGTYTIGNTSFQDIKHDEILNSMTVVLQETELFNVSLLENITMFKEVDGKLLEDAVRVAFLEDVISALPGGLDTIVGEKGVRLSGGQRQRVGIARAIYKNSPILLLDEATSNLDYDTERVIVHNILSLGEKTIIAVAHRLSTIEKATKVYKFENGNLTLT